MSNSRWSDIHYLVLGGGVRYEEVKQSMLVMWLKLMDLKLLICSFEFSVPHLINCASEYILMYHMFLRLWSEISLFHKLIYDIAPGSILIGRDVAVCL